MPAPAAVAAPASKTAKAKKAALKVKVAPPVGAEHDPRQIDGETFIATMTPRVIGPTRDTMVSKEKANKSRKPSGGELARRERANGSLRQAGGKLTARRRA